MAKPWVHARSSAARFGGIPEDYIAIHDFFDSTKAALPDVRHRAVLHSAFGIFIVEKVFGTTIKNSDNIDVPVRDIGEQHVMEDLGTIPTLEKWLTNMPIEDWMMGHVKKKHNVSPGVKITESDGTGVKPPLADQPKTGEAPPFQWPSQPQILDGQFDKHWKEMIVRD